MSLTKAIPVLNTPDEVLEYLRQSNNRFLEATQNNSDISLNIRTETAENGQKPHTVIVTCSDSRVPPEHIFDAGIGELFVIRTAGNVIGNFELGSIEYGAEHLQAKLILILGHTGCGAVAAAIAGDADGHIRHILNEISAGISDNKNPAECEVLNVKNSINKVRNSEIIRHLEHENKVKTVGAIYNIRDGKVTFLD